MIDHTTTAAVFGAVIAAYVVGHHVGDYWIQSDHQAQHKGLPCWAGRIACAGHVLTYTATLAICLSVVVWSLRLPVNSVWASAGLTVSAVTHYWADRRTTLRWLATRLGKGEFYERGEGLASGAAHLDLLCTTWNPAVA
ncbi:hypothetical protein [Nocardia vaccinii]|uniref:hypothetical protein n=1 Tax=Nocardia vaccinii TaxID=1822 RepID=UPI00082A8B1C|nr:hypothetical protein [Nocardia vaccinii]